MHVDDKQEGLKEHSPFLPTAEEHCRELMQYLCWMQMASLAGHHCSIRFAKPEYYMLGFTSDVGSKLNRENMFTWKLWIIEVKALWSHLTNISECECFDCTIYTGDLSFEYLILSHVFSLWFICSFYHESLNKHLKTLHLKSMCESALVALLHCQ